MSVSSASLEILRINAGLTVSELCRRSKIHKQTYYNIISGVLNVSESVLVRIGKSLDMPYLAALHFLDRLYHLNIRINDIIFTESVPHKIQKLIINKHPVFKSKVNSQKNINQEHQNGLKNCTGKV